MRERHYRYLLALKPSPWLLAVTLYTLIQPLMMNGRLREKRWGQFEIYDETKNFS